MIQKILNDLFLDDTREGEQMKKVFLSVGLSIVAQLSTVISGLIIPRLILYTFGSDVNGLVSSITQFLNYISLLEGGVTGVVMAALYKPLNEGDNEKVSEILAAVKQFFNKIGLIYCAYTIGVGVLYPLLIHTKFEWDYIFTLTLILASNLLVQYFLSLSLKVLLDSDRKTYITSAVQILSIWVNLLVTVAAIKIWPEIHFVKLISGVVFLLQPLCYSIYVKNNYNIKWKARPDNDAIKHRWDGMGQNIAYFIHTNTDVVILTFFASLSDVSVYSVYFMVANSLKGFIMSISRVISPIIGKKLAAKDNDLNDVIDRYELLLGLITAFAYTNAANLILPFVKLYTTGVQDANYYRPVFGVVLLMAEALYCFREPYVGVAYAAGNFKETAKYAYVEAAMNLVISLLLVRKLGLLGIAIGTFISMLYRMIAHIFYLQNQVLYRPVKKAFEFQGIAWISMAIAMFAYKKISLLASLDNMTQWSQWIIGGLMSCLITIVVLLIAFFPKLKLIIDKKRC